MNPRFELGTRYESGEVVPENDAEAARLEVHNDHNR
jgi:hypothetical protein